MRYFATRNGWLLSEHSLRPCVRAFFKAELAGEVKASLPASDGWKDHQQSASSQRRVKVLEGPNLFCQSEEDVFYAMGLDYVHPWDRNTYKA